MVGVEIHRKDRNGCVHCQRQSNWAQTSLQGIKLPQEPSRICKRSSRRPHPSGIVIRHGDSTQRNCQPLKRTIFSSTNSCLCRVISMASLQDPFRYSHMKYSKHSEASDWNHNSNFLWSLHAFISLPKLSVQPIFLSNK